MKEIWKINFIKTINEVIPESLTPKEAESNKLLGMTNQLNIQAAGIRNILKALGKKMVPAAIPTKPAPKLARSLKNAVDILVMSKPPLITVAAGAGLDEGESTVSITPSARENTMMFVE